MWFLTVPVEESPADGAPHLAAVMGVCHTEHVVCVFSCGMKHLQFSLGSDPSAFRGG